MTTSTLEDLVDAFKSLDARLAAMEGRHEPTSGTAHDVYGQATRIAKATAAKHEPTRVVELFMAGDVEHAKQVIRLFCRDVPCCVTVTPTTYVYTGGEEAGFVVGFRNYPRFPSDAYTLRTTAADLADRLRAALGQRSWMLVDASGMTTWSRDDA